MPTEVFDTGALAKLEALKKNVSIAAERGLINGGAFLRMKLTDQILNSPGNKAQGGKAKQPPHQVSQGRFVRRREGKLVSSIKMQPKRGEVLIYARTAIAPYADKVAEWTRWKYGRNYFAITMQMYGKAVIRVFEREIGRAVHAANNLTPYVYENHNPSS